MLCKSCTIEKDQSFFYPRNKSTCKKCVIKRGVEQDRANPAAKAARQLKTRIKNREKYNAYYRTWYAKNGRSRTPEKQYAHYRVSVAIKKGELVRPTVCVECLSQARIEAHHDDYNKPLMVRWLCNRCHRKIHTGY